VINTYFGINNLSLVCWP